MLYIFVKGLRYAGESEAEAVKRETIMEKHNRRVEDLQRRNRQPMKCYRAWATKRGLIFE